MNESLNSGDRGGKGYDIAIHGGRVMDPFTRTNVVANVGIKNGKIATPLSSLI